MPGSADASDPTALGLDPGLPEAGFNAAGVLSAAGYDALVDASWATEGLLRQTRSVVVLATGGTAFFRAFARSAEAGADPHRDPVDRYCRRVVEAAAAFEQSQGHAATACFDFEQRDGRFADFVALARAAGLLAPSRLAIGLHPRFGPWLAVRALLFTSRPLACSLPDPGFDPCTGCPAPCAAACPGAALPASGFDVARCRATSARLSACQTGCAARRACVVGPTHRYDADAEAWHRRAALSFAAPASRAGCDEVR